MNLIKPIRNDSFSVDKKSESKSPTIPNQNLTTNVVARIRSNSLHNQNSNRTPKIRITTKINSRYKT